MPTVKVTDYIMDANDEITNAGDKIKHVTWSQLAWGAITVGRRNHFDLYRYGFASRMEMVWRVAMVYANLNTVTVQQVDYFGKSDAFRTLNPSEKGAVSYFLGLAMAKVAAEDEYGVSWLMHLDVYSHGLVPRGIHVPILAQPGNSRPDLIGQDANGQWLVMESKGRTGAIDAKLRKLAKNQSRKILTVSQQAPRWRVGSIISLAETAMRLELVDPPGAAAGAIAIELPSHLFVAEYYRPIVGSIADAAEVEEVLIGGKLYLVAILQGSGFGVGLLAPLYRLLHRAFDAIGFDTASMANLKAELRDEVVRLLRDRQHYREGEDLYIGKDGVVVMRKPNFL